MHSLPKNYSPSAYLLKDRVILVTGASRGIGRAVSKALACYGATVILLARNLAQLSTLYDEILALNAAPPVLHPMDLETAGLNTYETLKYELHRQFGRLDGLLHNAAGLGNLTPIEYYSVETWYKVIQLNINSCFLLNQALLPLLKSSKDASIVFNNNHRYRSTQAYWGAYGISNQARETLMHCLAAELQAYPQLRVNSLDPGKIHTQFRLEAYPAEDKSILKKPEDIVNYYLYLLGPDSRTITGQSFSIETQC